MKDYRLLGTAKAERENTFRATHYMGSVSASDTGYSPSVSCDSCPITC